MTRFKKLGVTPECIAVEGKYARSIYEKALAMCREYGLVSERAVALMFDICVQNGSINSQTKARILAKFPVAGTEMERLVIVANCRADAASPEWVEDVRERKLCIANGSGTVHKRGFDFERQYQITLIPAADISNSERRVA